MSMASESGNRFRGSDRRPPENQMAKEPPFDPDLTDLPPPLRWREWMARVEATLFAAPGPVGREALARIVGRDCVLDLLIEDIAAALQDRPYELARTPEGWYLRTRARHAPAIRAALGLGDGAALSPADALILTAIAYLQPVTRTELSRITGREVSRDRIARLYRQTLIARGPRSPDPGAPYTYVTTNAFLAHFALTSLRDLPDIEALEDAGLLQRTTVDIDMPMGGEE